MLLKARAKCGNRFVRKFDRPLRVRIQKRNQGLGEPGKIPLRDRRLVTVGVTSQFIDRAKGSRRVVRIHEGAGSKIDCLSRKRGVVGVHDAMDETDMHPTRDQRSLALYNALKERQEGPLRVSGVGEMTIDHVASEAFN